MSVATCAEPTVSYATQFVAAAYDLAATLDCGQAFRWQRNNHRWSAVIHGRWVEVQQQKDNILVRTATSQTDWKWLQHYLQSEVTLATVLATFPQDEPMRQAIAACHGLRLLRQDPWECLASFILSSTKQIVQIRQIIATLCERHGDQVIVPPGEPNAFAFPTAQQVARLNEAELRACKMGFRAPNLLQVARRVASGEFDLDALPHLDLPEARARLVSLPGVGPKIADCVLLFAYGFPTAFPVDVWVIKALQRFYFRNRRVKLERLRSFSATYFGPHGGYAQQYLFHGIRLADKKVTAAPSI